MDRGGYRVVRIRHTGRGAYLVIDGVRSDRTPTDADALIRRVSRPNGRKGSVARDIILDDDVFLWVLCVIAGPIHSFCKAYR